MALGWCQEMLEAMARRDQAAGGGRREAGRRGALRQGPDAEPPEVQSLRYAGSGRLRFLIIVVLDLVLQFFLVVLSMVRPFKFLAGLA